MIDNWYEIQFLKGFLLTQSVEISVVLLFFLKGMRAESGLRVFAVVFAANSATLPYMWFILPKFLSAYGVIIVGETAVFVTEALIYCFVSGWSVRKAFAASFTANACSVAAGLMLMPPFG
jgi:hypothetical protein